MMAFMTAILHIGTKSWISMSRQCLPSSFGSIRLTILEQMWFEDFQDGHRGGYLGYRNKNDFGNTESLCHSNALYKVSAQSNLPFGRRRHLKNFKMATMAAILNIRTEWFYQFWMSMFSQCLQPCFDFIQLSLRKQMCFEDFQDVAILDIGTEQFQSDLAFGSRCSLKNYFSNSESACHPNASDQLSAQSDLPFRSRCQKCEKLTTDDRQQAKT